MTEEKKDDRNEQPEFLDEHDAVLKSIDHKDDTPDEKTEDTKEAASAETGEEEGSEAHPKTAEKSPSTPPAPKKKKRGKKPAQRNRHSAQHEEVLKKQALEQSEVKEVLVFFRKYARPAAIVVIAVCLFILADRSLKARRFKKEAAADTALLEANTVADLQEIVDDYAATPAAPLALMELARKKFNDGEIDEAEALYNRFTSKHAGHELALQAELNLITCKEAKSQFGEAHLLYGQFAREHAESFLAPAAMLGQARCLEALDELNEAQIAYEDVMVRFPETDWSRIAEANLKTVLNKKQRQ